MKLLTIAIPTYNRAKVLKKCLDSIFNQIDGLNNYVDILVSDNNSNDETFNTVNGFKKRGCNIIYNKNKINLGMDMNFKFCFNYVNSKYIWVLGDDDYILEGSLKNIVEILRDNDFGVLFLETRKLKNNDLQVFTSPQKLLSNISFNITFISSVIVKTNHIKNIDFDKYTGSYLNYLQVYLDGIFLNNINAKLNKITMNIANDMETTGGYNFFKVFVRNYLDILKDYRASFPLYYYELEKFKLLKSFVRPFLLLAVQKKDTNFEFKGYGKILFKKYWYLPYFYLMWIYIYIVKFLK